MPGSFVDGLRLGGQGYAGGPWDWLSPFSVMTGSAVAAGYALLTLWEAASPPATLGFVLAGVLILMPFVLGYTLHTYRLFRGKTTVNYG